MNFERLNHRLENVTGRLANETEELVRTMDDFCDVSSDLFESSVKKTQVADAVAANNDITRAVIKLQKTQKVLQRIYTFTTIELTMLVLAGEALDKHLREAGVENGGRVASRESEVGQFGAGAAMLNEAVQQVADRAADEGRRAVTAAEKRADFDRLFEGG